MGNRRGTRKLTGTCLKKSEKPRGAGREIQGRTEVWRKPAYKEVKKGERWVKRSERQATDHHWW